MQQVDDILAGDVAAGTLGVRTATSAGHGRIDHAHAGIEAGQDVRQGLPVSVMEVHRQRRHRHLGSDGLQHLGGLVWRADADGVAQRDLVAAKCMQLARHAHDIGDGHVALVRAAEHGGDIAAHFDAVGGGTFQHRAETRDGFVDGRVDVLLVEGLGRGGEHRHFLDADGACAVVAGLVRHQHRIRRTRASLDGGEHLGGVGQLRHPLRTDEAGRLDAEQAGARQPVDQFHLVGSGDEGLLVLQTVAWPDLDDADEIGRR